MWVRASRATVRSPYSMLGEGGCMPICPWHSSQLGWRQTTDGADDERRCETVFVSTIQVGNVIGNSDLFRFYTVESSKSPMKKNALERPAKHDTPEGGWGAGGSCVLYGFTVR